MRPRERNLQSAADTDLRVDCGRMADAAADTASPAATFPKAVPADFNRSSSKPPDPDKSP
jgi:hypothetical protein